MITPSSSSALSMGIASTVRVGPIGRRARRCTRGRPGRRECGWSVARVAARPSCCPRPGRWDSARRRLVSSRGDVVGGHDAQDLTVEAENQPTFRRAQPDRVLGQCVEHRLQVEGGPPDHLEQLAGRRLLLERHPQLAVARLQLGEEAHVLDRDDGLVREGLEQLDLLVGEEAGLRPSPTEIAPIGRPSRIIGTASVAWKPAARAKSFPAYSGSANTSGTLTTSRVTIVRTPRRLRPGRIGNNCECRR